MPQVDLKLYKGPEDLKTATSTLTQLTKDALNPKAEFWEVEKEFKAHLNNHIEVCGFWVLCLVRSDCWCCW